MLNKVNIINPTGTNSGKYVPGAIALFLLLFLITSPSARAGDSPEKTAAERELLAAADLEIQSVTCTLDTLYPGQTEVPVEISVSNPSDTSLFIQMVELIFSVTSEGDRGSDYRVSGEQYPNVAIPSGGEEIFTLSVEVEENALQSTVIKLDAYVVGRRMDTYQEVATSTTSAVVLDRFSEISYSGDDGTASWNGDWQEINDYGDAEYGDVRVVDSPYTSGYRLRIGSSEDLSGGCGILRAVELSSAQSAVFSFDRQRDPSVGFSGLDLAVQISDDGGSSWTTIHTTGSGQDATPERIEIDITPYISPDTRIRFITEGDEGNGYIYMDNIRVDYSLPLGADSWIVLSDFINVIAALYDTKLTPARSDDSLICISSGDKTRLNSIYYLNSGDPLAGIPLDGSSRYRLVLQLNPDFDWDYNPDHSGMGYFALRDTAAGFGMISAPDPGIRELLLTESMVPDQETSPADFIIGATDKNNTPLSPWNMVSDPYEDTSIDQGNTGEYATINNIDTLSRSIIDCVDGAESWNLTNKFEKNRYYFHEIWFQPEMTWSHGDIADIFFHLEGDQPDQEISQLHLKFRMVDDDTLGPSFSNFEPEIIPEGSIVSISCSISDSSGVFDDDTGSGGQGVYLLWDTDGSLSDDCNEIQMDHTGGGVYETVSDLGTFNDGQEIIYRVFAHDNDIDSGISDRALSSSELHSVQIVGSVYLSDQPESLTPESVYSGQDNISFTIALNNSMPDGILIQTSSYLTFSGGGDTITVNLANETLLGPGASSFPIGFEPVDIPSGFPAPDTFSVTLHLEGWYYGTGSSWNQTWIASGTNRIAAKRPRLIFKEHNVPSYTVHPGDRMTELLRMELRCESLEDNYLDSLVISNVTAGLGQAPESDQNISGLYLYRQKEAAVTSSSGSAAEADPVYDSGNRSILRSRPFSEEDTLAASGYLNDGSARFNLDRGKYIPSGGSVYYYVFADIDSFMACDGDSLDICIYGADSIYTSGEADIFLENTPFNSEGKTPVDGSLSHQTVLADILPDSLYSEENNRPVLAADIFPNGYKPDILNSLSVRNDGNPDLPDVIEELCLWRDNGDSLFSSGSDEYLGSFQFTGSLYQISGLSSPLTLPRRFFVTATFNRNFSDPMDVRLAIPVGGIGMKSDNDGPIDEEISPDSSQVLIRREVVSLTEYPSEEITGNVYPGERDAELYGFRLENGTLQQLVLDSLTVSGDSTLFECSSEKSIWLYSDNGDGEFDPSSDTEIGSSVWSVTTVSFTDIELGVPSDSYELLFVSAHLDSFMTADGDTLSFCIEGPEDIALEFSTETEYELEASFPLIRKGYITDGMLAHQIRTYPLADSTLSGNITDAPVLDFLIPGNGCRPDTLETLKIINDGTAGKEQIDTVKLWIDDGDGLFDSETDREISRLLMQNSDTMSCSDLFLPIPGSPGIRMYVTVTLKEGYESGAVFRAGIPENGVQVTSGNDGPIERSVFSASEVVIPPPDRITFYTSIMEDHRVYPGREDVLNMVLGAYNSYSDQRLLKSIELYERGSIRPDEISRVSAYTDADGNGLFNPAVDSFLVSTASEDSRYMLENIDLPLPSYRNSLLFITFSAVKDGLRDSVSVDFNVPGEPSIVFGQEGVKVEGEFPLNSAGMHYTDGMIRSQLEIISTGDVRVSPGESDIPCFSFRVPCNGTVPDSLFELVLENRGSCEAGNDISTIKLWKESGDDNRTFDAGQETLLGHLFWDGSAWKTMSSEEPLSGIDCEGLLLHLTADISGSALDRRNLQLVLPVGGLEVLSGNDGPLDSEAVSPSMVEITTDPMITEFETPDAVTRGQEFNINMLVSNVSDSALTGVYPDSFSWSGEGAASIISGPVPTQMDIPSGEKGMFAWSLNADSTSRMVFYGKAAEDGGDGTSALEHSDTVEVENVPEGFFLTLSDLSPVSLNRGRKDISVIEMIMSYREGCDRCADVKLDSLTFSFMEENNNPLSVGDIASRIKISDETRLLGTVSTSGWDASLINFNDIDTLLFSSGDSRTLKLSMDIADSASVSNFKIGMKESGCVSISDENSSEGISYGGSSFPWETNTITIKSPATSLEIRYEEGIPAEVNRSQPDVEALKLNISNCGIQDGADISLSEITLSIKNQFGDTIPCSDVINGLRLEDDLGFNLYSTEYPGPSALIECNFDRELIISPGMPVLLSFFIDCPDDPNAGGLSITLEDSASVTARDINSGKIVAVIPDTLNGTYFPLSSGSALFRDPLSGFLANGAGILPGKLAPGEKDVGVMRLGLEHPGDSGESAAEITGLTVTALDQEGNRIRAGDYMDYIRVMSSQDTLATQYLTGENSSDIQVDFSDTLLMEAGNEDTLLISADLIPSAPCGFIQFQVHGDGVGVSDATDGRILEIVEGDFPITSGIGRIIPPPERVTVSAEGLIPANIVAGETVELMELQFQLVDSTGSAEAEIEELRLEVLDKNNIPIHPGNVLEDIGIQQDENQLSSSFAFSAERAAAEPDQPLRLDSNNPVCIKLTGKLKNSITAEMFSVSITSPSDISCRDANGGEAVVVEPAAGWFFPLSSGRTAVLTRDMRSAFTNYPNPFVPGRENTRITYFLPGAGRVTLIIYTLEGHRVITLLDNASRNGGLYQDVWWDGRNGRGDMVINGVYFLVIREKVNGREYEFRRKVSVVR